MPILSVFHTEKDAVLSARDFALVVEIIVIHGQGIITIFIATFYNIIIVVVVVHSRFVIIVVEIVKRTETRIGTQSFKMLVETGLVIVAHKEETRFNFIEDCIQVALLDAQFKVIDCEPKMAIYVEAKRGANRPDQRSTLGHAKIMLC